MPIFRLLVATALFPAGSVCASAADEMTEWIVCTRAKAVQFSASVEAAEVIVRGAFAACAREEKALLAWGTSSPLAKLGKVSAEDARKEFRAMAYEDLLAIVLEQRSK